MLGTLAVAALLGVIESTEVKDVGLSNSENWRHISISGDGSASKSMGDFQATAGGNISLKTFQLQLQELVKQRDAIEIGGTGLKVVGWSLWIGGAVAEIVMAFIPITLTASDVSLHVGLRSVFSGVVLLGAALIIWGYANQVGSLNERLLISDKITALVQSFAQNQAAFAAPAPAASVEVTPPAPAIEVTPKPAVAAQPTVKPAAPAAKSKCSIDQVLKMKDAGLGEAQIRAACEG